jgi:hypothetical protein
VGDGEQLQCVLHTLVVVRVMLALHDSTYL